MQNNILLLLIAPNVSEQMGGEAIKALQMFQELTKQHPNTIQITHARNRSEIERLQLANVMFVADSWVPLAIWNTVILRSLLDVWFSQQAVRLAEKIVQQKGFDQAVIHQTEPNSPVAPRALSSRHINVFGPINGNIYYPAAFRARETRWNRLRRVLHMPLQRLNKWLPKGIKQAEQILVAGGERTYASLRTGGCPANILSDSLDCGVRDKLLDSVRVAHQGVNLRFVHFGRLVFHKGTALIIESLVNTRLPVCLDIVGRGPELEACQALVQRHGLGDRVRFLGWYTAQEELFESFHAYRGVVLPSLEDANGIVIQEAMAFGLPPICLDWGGPGLLIDHGRSGYLVPAGSREQIVAEIGNCMDRLAEDGALAESMSIAARAAAEKWRWSTLTSQWLAAYPSRRRSPA